MLNKYEVTLFRGIVIFCVFALAGCSENSTDAAQSASVVRPVNMQAVNAGDAKRILRFPAVVNDKQLVELSFVSGGKVIELPITDAQPLKKGQLIAKLDPRDLQNKLATATAQFNNAEKEYNRALSLIKTNAIAKSTLSQRKTDRDVSLAQLNSAQKALNDSELVAPFDGVVAHTLIEKDQFVSGGQTVVKLIGATAMEAAINVPAKYLSELYKNKQTFISSHIILDSEKTKPIPARYKSAVLLADKSTQTYLITFEFSVPEGVLSLPGMNATIEVQMPTALQDDHVTLPATAITSDGAGTYVWVVEPDNMTVSKRYITLADGVGEILTGHSGLQKGEIIVTTGVAYLHEGMQVRQWK